MDQVQVKVMVGIPCRKFAFIEQAENFNKDCLDKIIDGDIFI